MNGAWRKMRKRKLTRAYCAECCAVEMKRRGLDAHESKVRAFIEQNGERRICRACRRRRQTIIVDEPTMLEN